MNTLQIYCKLLSLKCLNNVNFDVLAKDQLAMYQIPKPYGLCINVSNSNHPGTHWVSMYCASGSNKILFFDPFGMPSIFYGKEFINFVQNQNGFIEENKKQYQSMLSDCCGEFCIFFLNLTAEKITLNKLSSYFSNKLHQNDNIVKEYVKNIKSKCISIPETFGVCDQICRSYEQRRK